MKIGQVVNSNADSLNSFVCRLTFVWKQIIPNLVHMFSFLTKCYNSKLIKKTLNYNENLKFIPYGKGFIFMP